MAAPEGIPVPNMLAHKAIRKFTKNLVNTTFPGTEVPPAEIPDEGLVFLFVVPHHVIPCSFSF
jgi:hypothetical protein